MNNNGFDCENSPDTVAQIENVDVENADTDTVVQSLCQIAIDQQEQLEQKDERIEELENDRDTLRTELDETKDELANYQERNESDKADIRQQVHELDNMSAGNSSVLGKLHDKVNDVKENVNNSSSDESPLEQICRLPKKVARDALSKNQSRAREIVTSLNDVKTEQAMAGTVIPSTSIREYLMEEYGSAHYQTVSRVMEFLSDMGGSDAQVRKNGDNPWLKDGGSDIHAVVLENDLVKSIRSIEQLDSEEIEGVTNGVRPTLSGG